MKKLHQKILWGAVAAGAGMLASRVSQSALESAWRATWDEDPPWDPADKQVRLSDALIWAAASGLAAGVVGVLVQRSAAHGWHRVMGKWPPI